MAKKIVQIDVKVKYTIEVDPENEIVKEYEDDHDLISDLVSYNFSVLPVIGNGVEVKDTKIIKWSF